MRSSGFRFSRVLVQSAHHSMLLWQDIYHDYFGHSEKCVFSTFYKVPPSIRKLM